MKFYRYDTTYYADGPELRLSEFNLYSETPKGYWIGWGHPEGLHSDKRWVSKTGKKRYAYPTKAEALHSFIYRKKREIKILKARLEGSEWSKQTALDLQKKGINEPQVQTISVNSI